MPVIASNATVSAAATAKFSENISEEANKSANLRNEALKSAKIGLKNLEISEHKHVAAMKAAEKDAANVGRFFIFFSADFLIDIILFSAF